MMNIPYLESVLEQLGLEHLIPGDDAQPATQATNPNPGNEA